MASSITYSIVANPASGSLSINQRRTQLQTTGDILQAKVYGLDTTGPQELAQVAREQAARCDVLVVAGGDGTFSLVINAVDLSRTALAFLPFGTGNALTHALGYRGGPAAIASRIKSSTFHDCDLIDCDGKKKAFMVSLGIDGAVIRRYEHYRALGHRGLKAHLRAGLAAFLRDYRPTGCRMRLDEGVRRMERLLSLMVVKQPYFGMGLKVVPRARWNDGNLHTQVISSGITRALAGLLSGFTIGNRIGEYRAGKRLTVRLDDPLPLQIDGDLAWTADRFTFRVLPGVLRLKY
jgi:diacylglycerol kinase (ATP)